MRTRGSPRTSVASWSLARRPARSARRDTAAGPTRQFRGRRRSPGCLLPRRRPTVPHQARIHRRSTLAILFRHSLRSKARRHSSSSLEIHYEHYLHRQIDYLKALGTIRSRAAARALLACADGAGVRGDGRGCARDRGARAQTSLVSARSGRALRTARHVAASDAAVPPSLDRSKYFGIMVLFYRQSP